MGTKTDKQESFMLNVSEYLFRLTTECLRLYSNETSIYQNLTSLISARLLDSFGAERHEIDTIRGHFAAIPTHGTVMIHLNIPHDKARALEEARQTLETRLGTSLALGDVISALLFDYVVEQKVGRILRRLEHDELIPTSSDSPGDVLRH